ncbi:MAG: hypothetical protein RIQ81_2470 [Pseudomonadota bacterium]|jgi:hypothetical protein
MRSFLVTAMMVSAGGFIACKSGSQGDLSFSANAADALKCRAQIETVQDIHLDNRGKTLQLEPQGGEPLLYAANDAGISYNASVDDEAGVIDFQIFDKTPKTGFKATSKGFVPDGKYRRNSSKLEVTNSKGRFTIYCE